MAKLHVKKGDRVKVIAGKDKGTVGEIIAVDPESQRVTVSGVNIVKRHRKDQPDGSGRNVVKGGIISFEAPIHVSNVALVVRHEGKEVVTRVGYERQPATKRRRDGSEYESTRSVRIARKTGKEI
ncbi:MAG: 50S ribosomal protein L24 [Propionibacteriaceae bacterium]|jgi:large subunit ribosomal protein L24|nr:50S ribosomal protein L24 [Propionibacteriaceae bacterium]